MKQPPFTLRMLAVALCLPALGCGDDDGRSVDMQVPDAMMADGALPDAAPDAGPADAGIDEGMPPADAGLDEGMAFACPAVGNLMARALAEGQCEVGGVLTEDATLSADIVWFLDGRLQVGSDAALAALDIDAGTRVLGADVEDHLLVWPGSALRANGTGANPVHFLSADADVEGSGEWGGVFLRGFPGDAPEGSSEGASRLDYVVVAEAGAPTVVEIGGAETTYSDNLVLNGVDASTTLTFVQSHGSARDGIHILDGDPRLSWILVTAAARDGIWYRDFSGLIKDLMVIHARDMDGSTGRSGIYASETADGDSHPRIVNATLMGRDSSSVAAGEGDNEFGILFADNTDQVRLANVLIANFRNGCFEADDGADLSAIDTSVPGPNYLDGVHCANEQGPNPMFGVVRDDALGFPEGTVAPNNSFGRDGLVYYNGVANPIVFTGEIAERSENFTASWYLNNIGGRANGLLADATSLNGFLDGDSNNDGVIDAADTSSPFIISDAMEFNLDVAADTGGYDLTHIGAVRGGAPSNDQFDGWTVATGADDGFVVALNPAFAEPSECPSFAAPLPRSGGRSVCELSGTYAEDLTLTSAVDWQLEGRVQIGNEMAQVTLTIEAGTRIQGDAEGAVDYLLVWRGSAIDARGTGARPVRFTSDDAGVEGSGEWGGLFLRGYIGDVPAGASEGASRLDYVVVAEGGAAVDVEILGTTTTYSDNLILNGVDQTTTLTFVQSHGSARDGIHILNGDPRLSWILVTGAARDGIWYRDFTGLIKDLMVIHDRDADGSRGRSGIYASETNEGDSNPRIVNATLMGRDSSSEAAGPSDNEFGILFADNTDQIRLANVLIANFRNGCFEADDGADLSGITTSTPGPTYLDGVHCAHEAGANPTFGVVRDDATGFVSTVALNNSNGDGLVYYNGAGGELSALSNTVFSPTAGGIQLTGELAERGDFFTAGWYLNNIRGIGNGLAGDATNLNGFLDGDTNQVDGVTAADVGSPFIINAMNPFNLDVADDTGGYDLTHIGAVRGGAITNRQFDGWTVNTVRGRGLVVRQR